MKENISISINKKEYSQTKSYPSVIANANLFCDIGVTINDDGMSHKFNFNISIPCNFENIQDSYRKVRVYVGQNITNEMLKLYKKELCNITPLILDADFDCRVNKCEVGYSQGISKSLGNWEFVKLNIGIHCWSELEDIDKTSNSIKATIQDIINKEQLFMDKINNQISINDYILFSMPKAKNRIGTQQGSKIEQKKENNLGHLIYEDIKPKLSGGDYVFTFGKFSQKELGFQEKIRDIRLDQLNDYYEKFLKKTPNKSSNLIEAIKNIELYYDEPEVVEQLRILRDDKNYWLETNSNIENEKEKLKMGPAPF